MSMLGLAPDILDAIISIHNISPPVTKYTPKEEICSKAFSMLMCATGKAGVLFKS